MGRPDSVRIAVKITGTVQGVGFRPFVYSAAARRSLSGFVRNDGGDVYIEVEGPEETVTGFVQELRSSPPPLSRVRDVTVTRLDKSTAGTSAIPGATHEGFRVIESRSVSGGEPGISPDVSLCPNCRRELLDPSDRRHLYPFINCTDCGPRFTIVEDIPYDRERTSMRRFTMCPDCAGEYRDPGNRRFHAEPDACWDCGPRVRVCGHGKETAAPATAGGPEERTAWIAEVQAALARGLVLGVKGVGGFHLACDALNAGAVARLRARKRRPAMPFAIMVRDIETALDWFRVSLEERELLEAQASPIVILEKGPECPLLDGVAPGLDHIGVMLPYSPMHTLLFARLPGLPAPSPALVMTSGNATGMPLMYLEDEAVRDLGPVVDRFVLHDRPIVRPCDDSVARIALGEPLFYRRSRGYVPGDVPVESPHGLRVFGAGGEGKNTFCMLKGGRARLSQHIGDLHNEESLERYRSAASDLTALYRFAPDLLAVDMHPGYRVSDVAREVFPKVPEVAVQHHHAHLAQVMAERNLAGPCVGIILDGTGYGTDGHVWGGEVLYGSFTWFERRFRLREVRMPGGEMAVFEPWRMAVAYVKGIRGESGLPVAMKVFPALSRSIETLWPALDWSGYPLTSSAGRLFDAVSALCGICPVSTYDGESAGLLGEEALRANEVPAQPGGSVAATGFQGEGEPVRDLDTFPLVDWALESALRGDSVRSIAAGFHDALARMLAGAAAEVARETGAHDVVLSGGVFQNPFFLRLAVDYVREAGLRPAWPRVFPPNDGGISLGQAAIAAWTWSQKEK